MHEELMAPPPDKNASTETVAFMQNGLQEVPTLKTPDVPDTPLLMEDPKKPPKSLHLKKRYIFLACCLLLILVGSGFTYHEYQNYSAEYHIYVSQAKTAAQSLQSAVALLQGLQKNPLDLSAVSQANQKLHAARTTFVQLNENLKALPSFFTSIPGYGPKLVSALRLLPIAINVSQTGILGCTMLDTLISRFQDPLKSQQSGLTPDDFASINENFQQLLSLFNQIVLQVNHLQAQDLQLDPRLGKLVDMFHKDLPKVQSWIADAKRLLALAPMLLGVGKPASYLLELMDSTELRPGGGFIGNYGLVTFSGGRLSSVHITDTYLLDEAFQAAGHTISYPSAFAWFDLAPGSWSLRDSNLDADFPTNARYGEAVYQHEGGPGPVQGVIAITPALIQRALAITGPIIVPEYHDTVTAQNLVDRIHYYQLGQGRTGNDVPSSDGHSSERKRFTELLGEHFLTRFRQLPSASLPKFVQLLIQSLHTKDVQVYLNSGVAESYLTRFHLDAAIQAPSEDGLFVVDANIAPSKANAYITNVLHDQVVINARGDAIHTTTLSYIWNKPGPIFGSAPYRDYIRVYAPPGSILQSQDGWEPRNTYIAFGSRVWAGFFTLDYGASRTITLTWSVPGAAKKDAQGWHYQYLLQHQAGALWTVNLQIALPSCATKVHRSNGLDLSKNGMVALLVQSFTEDVDAGVDYICKS